MLRCAPLRLRFCHQTPSVQHAAIRSIQAHPPQTSAASNCSPMQNPPACALCTDAAHGTAPGKDAPHFAFLNFPNRPLVGLTSPFSLPPPPMLFAAGPVAPGLPYGTLKTELSSIMSCIMSCTACLTPASSSSTRTLTCCATFVRSALSQ
jgi:hypothetical protein